MWMCVSHSFPLCPGWGTDCNQASGRELGGRHAGRQDWHLSHSLCGGKHTHTCTAAQNTHISSYYRMSCESNSAVAPETPVLQYFHLSYCYFWERRDTKDLLSQCLMRNNVNLFLQSVATFPLLWWKNLGNQCCYLLFTWVKSGLCIFIFEKSGRISEINNEKVISQIQFTEKMVIMDDHFRQ